MKKEALRWVCFGVSAVVVGPIVGRLVSAISALDGSGAATGLVSASPAMGLGLLVLALFLAGLTGLLGAWLVSARAGLFYMGTSLAWGAWGTGRFVEVVRAADMENVFGRLALEGLVIGSVGAAMAFVVVWIGRGDEHDRASSPASGQSLLGLATLIAVGGAAAWVVARSGDVGQTFAAAASAGVFGGVAARTIANGCSARTLLLAIPVLAAAGPMVANARMGGAIGTEAYSGTIAGIGLIMPLDWVAGLLVGLPVGLGWAGSLVEEKDKKDAQSPAHRAVASG